MNSTHFDDPIAPDHPFDCNTCGGRGFIATDRANVPDMPCPTCSGDTHSNGFIIPPDVQPYSCGVVSSSLPRPNPDAPIPLTEPTSRQVSREPEPQADDQADPHLQDYLDQVEALRYEFGKLSQSIKSVTTERTLVRALEDIQVETTNIHRIADALADALDGGQS